MHYRILLMAALEARDGNRCMICKVDFVEDDYRQIDHIVPRSQGGKDEFTNLQLSHRRCNILKGGNSEPKSPIEIREKRLVQRELAKAAIKEHKNKSRAAKALGISRPTLYSWLE